MLSNFLQYCHSIALSVVISSIDSRQRILQHRIVKMLLERRKLRARNFYDVFGVESKSVVAERCVRSKECLMCLPNLPAAAMFPMFYRCDDSIV